LLRFIEGIHLVNCEFEEKEYEQPLNSELGNHNLWSPGQVFESVVGFDAALKATNWRFWLLWGKWEIFKIRKGIILDWEIWDIIEKRWTDKTFPKFKFNLFVQHKVPEYMKTKNSYPQTLAFSIRGRRMRARAKNPFNNQKERVPSNP